MGKWAMGKVSGAHNSVMLWENWSAITKSETTTQFFKNIIMFCGSYIEVGRCG